MFLKNYNWLTICVLLCLFNNITAQTFNGVGGLPFPPSGTIGITQSQNTVTGVGVLGGCTYIDNVTINLDHTWVGDIAIFLIAPNGTFIELSSGNGGAANNYTNTVFSDFAPLNIIDGFPPYTGDFQPEGRQNSTLTNPYPNSAPPGTFTFANTFNGVNANGTWTLYLNDYVGGDVGFLNSWSITFVNGGTSFTTDLGPDLIVCAGDDITLNASNTASSPTYLWSNNTTDQTLEINNIAITNTYTVTVTDASGCTATDEVLVTVNPAPIGNPVNYERCESSPPNNAIFDLTSIVAAIGNGLPVTFYSDFDLNNQITNTTAFISTSTTIYAVVTQGTCSTPPIPITLVVVNNDPSEFNMNIVQESLCETGLMEVLFTLPNPGNVYTYNYDLNCTNGNQSNTITTSANPIFFAITANCTLIINSITNITSGCTTTFSPPLTDNILVTDAPDIIVNTMEICNGQSIDLENFVTTPSGAPITFHSATPPSILNILSSTSVSPTSTTTYYAQSVLNDCESVVPLIVTVLPGGIPFTTNLSVCENGSLINLTPFVSPPTLTGTWSGIGVNGNSFDPSGLSGSIVLNFQPDDICYDEGTLTINVTPNQNINLGTTNICSSDQPLDLNTIEDPNFGNGTWSGQGTSGGFFNPALASGIVTLTFTPTDICISPATTNINVLPAPTPILVSNIIICQGATIDLSDYILNPTNLDINIYNNLPATPSNEISNPIVTINFPTTFYIKVTDMDGCFGIAPLLITTAPGGTPNLGTATLCQTQTSFNLNTLNDPNAGSGTWSGFGVNGNIIDLTIQSGTVNVIFTPDNNCFTTTDTDIEILLPQDPVLGTDNLCSTNGNYNLTNIADPLFTSGIWSGPGVNNNIFNPTNLSGNITLSFDPDQFCVNNATTQITITPSQIPSLGTLTVCETTNIVDLNTIQDPIYATGTWSGPGVSGSIFETAGQQGINLLTFTSDETCVFPSNTTINVTPLTTPQLQTISVCASSPPVNLALFVDPNFPLGDWSGDGVLNGFFDPNDLEGVIPLTFIASDGCTLPSITSATLTSSPIVTDIVTLCDQSTQTYTVQFNILGGESSSYTVNGNPSTSTFVSSSFASQSNYSFFVTDANQCDVITLQGSKNCDCITSAGTMNFANAPLKACITGSVNAIANNDAAFDQNDRLIYILHDAAGPTKGNILATSKTPIFTFPTNGSIGAIYYISAAVADSLGSDSILFSDACLSVAAGIPVSFYEPEITINPMSNICVSECTDINFNLTGEGPFRFTVETSVGNNILKNDTVTTLNPSYNIAFCPSDFNNITGLVNIKIQSFADKNCNGKRSSESINFTVSPTRINNIDNQLCQGENIIVNGNVYNASNPIGTEIIPSNNNATCDSIINVALKFVSPSTNNLNQQLCINQSLNINGTIYNVNNPSGIEVLSGANKVGCDSIIQISLNFTNEIISNLNPILCPGESVVVNGKTYDQNNPSGTETIVSNDGAKCDSIINISLSFKAPLISSLSQTLCDGDALIINGKTYDQTNPTGQEILRNASSNGCDSIVNISLNFSAPKVSSLRPELCDGESLNVNGTEYTKSNPSGQEIIANGASNGCDSIININLSFLPISTSIISDTICITESIVINGEVFDINNTNSEFLLNNASINGCDSTLLVNIYFYKESIDTVRLTIKRGEVIVYNGVTFDENNLQALTSKPDLTNNGCTQYSFVIVELEQEFITAKFNILSETCPQKNDGSIIIEEIKGCRNYSVLVNNIPINNTILPIEISGLQPGNYSIKIEGDIGCSFEENIIVEASPSQDFVTNFDTYNLQKGENIILDPSIIPTPTAISWVPSDFLSCDDCLSPTLFDVQNNIQYILYLTNANGCTYTRSLDVNIYEPNNEIVFPNIFSPNGDGKNDTWDILFTDNQRVTQLSIYDRWGNRVYTITPAAEQNIANWDGKMGSQDVNPGVYIYMVEILKSNGERGNASGDVLVIR